jgi:hypothetical protein
MYLKKNYFSGMFNVCFGVTSSIQSGAGFLILSVMNLQACDISSSRGLRVCVCNTHLSVSKHVVALFTNITAYTAYRRGFVALLCRVSTGRDTLA